MKQYKLLKDLAFYPAGTILDENSPIIIGAECYALISDWFEPIETNETFIPIKGGELLYNHLNLREGPIISPLTNDPAERRREAYIELNKEKERAERLASQAEEKFHNDKLRDQFAASALQALVAGNLKRFENPTNEADIYVPLLTNFAYVLAENMLIARSKYVRDTDAGN